MYTLLSGLYKYVFQKDEYCILILGLDNAGKTVGACSCDPSPGAVLLWFHTFSCLFVARTESKPVGHGTVTTKSLKSKTFCSAFKK